MAETSKALAVTRMGGPMDSDPTERANPSWREIESAIRRLNGDSCSLVILGIGPAPVPHMAIGGGEGGRHIVYATRDNLTFSKLINPQAASGRCLLVAGGQRGDYELRLCVGLQEALRAARTYVQTGRLDPALSWDGPAR